MLGVVFPAENAEIQSCADDAGYQTEESDLNATYDNAAYSDSDEDYDDGDLDMMGDDDAYSDDLGDDIDFDDEE